MNAPLCLSILGAGHIAEKMAATAAFLAGRGEIRPRAVAARDPARAAALAARFGFETSFGSYADLAADDATDLVYVATPNTLHAPHARLCLAAGKHVLCEKPFTVTEQQAAELLDLANEKHLYVAEAMWTWFAPTANKVKEWVETGAFGTIEQVRFNYHLLSIGYAPRVTDPMQAGGALLDIGVYPIHYLYRLFGYPTAVRCTGRLKDGIDLGEEIELSSVSLDDCKGLERYAIRGSKAKTSILMAHAANGAKLKRGLRTVDRVSGYGGMQNEFDRVAEEIRAGLPESRFVPQKATRDVMRILDLCRAQMGLVYPFEK